MNQITSLRTQKIIIVLTAAFASLFSMEAASKALGSFQIPSFAAITFYGYIFLVLWQIFIFDLHLKASSLAGFERTLTQSIKGRFGYMANFRHFLHFLNYLILPTIIYGFTAAILFINPFDQVIKQAFVVGATLALTLSFWYLKTVFLAHAGANKPTKQLIFLAKLYASFVAFTAAFGLTRHFGYEAEVFVLLVFCVTFLLFYQALFQHHSTSVRMIKFPFLTGVILGAIAYFIFLFWNVNYFSGALVLTAVYNTIWGIVHHKLIDKNLTREMVYEYLAVLFVILVIVIGSTNFAQKI